LNTIATGTTWCWRASVTSGLRSSGFRLVASTTVKRPRSSRLLAMKCSTANASAVADRSFSSSATSPRQKSEVTISVGRKCRRAKLDFPELDAPTSTTSDSAGI